MHLLKGAKELLRGNTPTLILSVLRAGPLHGYGIAREIERLSNQSLELKEGTLYPVLHSLERDGWLVSEWTGQADGRRSRVYQLTAEGREELSKRQAEWHSFTKAVNQVLSGGENA